MPTTTTYGPPLKLISGLTLYTDYPRPGDCSIYGTPVVLSGKPSSWKTVSKPVATKRRRPEGLALLTSMTSWSWDETIGTNAIQWNAAGNISDSSYPATSVSISHKNAVYTASVSASIRGLLSAVKDEEWNLSTFLGELPETLTFLVKVSNGLMQSYRAVKRGDMRKLRNIHFPLRNGSVYRGSSYAKVNTSRNPLGAPNASAGGTRVVDSASNKWMEWRYAVSPMVYDLEDALKYLHSSRTQVAVKRQEGKGKDSYKGKIISSVVTRPESYTSSCTSGVYYSVNPKVDAFKRLGLLNPIATLWELTPLSFVVDWFVDVGSYVGSLDAMAGTTVISKYQVVKTVEYSEAIIPTTTSKCGKSGGTVGSLSRKSYSRTLVFDLTPPAPVFSIGLNARRSIDAIALLRQFCK